MIEALRRTCQLHIGAYATMPAKKPRWLHEHRIIVEHLEKRETDRAVLALQAHLEAAAQHLLECMTAVEV